MKNKNLVTAPTILLIMLAGNATLFSHGVDVSGVHYRFEEAINPEELRLANPNSKILNLSINNEKGVPIPARFELTVNGRPYNPPGLGPHGLYLKSIDTSAIRVVLYTTDDGSVAIPLPDSAEEVQINAVRGYVTIPVSKQVPIAGNDVDVTITLREYSNILNEGWAAVDTHTHYDRKGADANHEFHEAMDGDNLYAINFMAYKSFGARSSLIGKQYAYGKEGEAFNGQQLITPGEEYRGQTTGHYSIMGITEIIEPVSIGLPYHFPTPLHALEEAHQQGAIGGVAHGGNLGAHTMAQPLGILGTLDFFEVSNTPQYRLDLWYTLMNAGFFVPIAAGTDLPIFPHADPWQPFLGEERTYVKIGEERGFESLKDAFSQNRIFISSGPLVELSVDDSIQIGDTRSLGPEGGTVSVFAELTSPVGLTKFEIVKNGKAVDLPITKVHEDGVHRWTIQGDVSIERSSWIAARGVGVTKDRLNERLNSSYVGTAHTAPIQILVGDKPIGTEKDFDFLIRRIRSDQNWYKNRGSFENPSDRDEVVEMFDRALAILNDRLLSVLPHLEAGDADQDLDFDQVDVFRAQVFGKYLTGQAATWGDGDWNGAPGGHQGSPPVGNGIFDQLDIIAALAPGHYLTGPYAAIAMEGTEGDEQTSLVYDADTGELRIDSPANTDLTSIHITSTENKFLGDKPAVLDGAFDNFATDNVFKATFGGSFGDLSLGNVLPQRLSAEEVAGDLSAIGSLVGGGELGAVDLVYIPEPSTIVLIGLGMGIALSTAVRKRRVDSRKCMIG